MSEKHRRSLLFVALAGAIGWSAWLTLNEKPAGAEDAAIELAKPTAASASPSRVAPDPAPRAAAVPPSDPRTGHERVRLALARADLFPVQSWYVPPPPPPPPPPAPPPPPPQAPPLPFSYMGRWQEGATVTYYLARAGAGPVGVRAGEVLDGVWRLESVHGRTLDFIYLPLNQMRSLQTGE